MLSEILKLTHARVTFCRPEVEDKECKISKYKQVWYKQAATSCIIVAGLSDTVCKIS